MPFFLLRQEYHHLSLLELFDSFNGSQFYIFTPSAMSSHDYFTTKQICTAQWAFMLFDVKQCTFLRRNIISWGRGARSALRTLHLFRCICRAVPNLRTSATCLSKRDGLLVFGGGTCNERVRDVFACATSRCARPAHDDQNRLMCKVQHQGSKFKF